MLVGKEPDAKHVTVRLRVDRDRHPLLRAPLELDGFAARVLEHEVGVVKRKTPVLQLEVHPSPSGEILVGVELEL